MTDKEIIDKYFSFIEEGKNEYAERQKDENTQKIVEAIRKITNGEFIGKHHSSTLIGWIENYDEQGRILNADPNYKDSRITVLNETYPITRAGWYAYIWVPNSNCGYTTCWSECREKFLFSLVDLRPDYVKIYDENKKKNRPIDTRKIEKKYEVVDINSKKNITKTIYIDGEKQSTTFIEIPFDLD